MLYFVTVWKSSFSWLFEWRIPLGWPCVYLYFSFIWIKAISYWGGLFNAPALLIQAYKQSMAVGLWQCGITVPIYHCTDSVIDCTWLTTLSGVEHNGGRTRSGKCGKWGKRDSEGKSKFYSRAWLVWFGLKTVILGYILCALYVNVWFYWQSFSLQIENVIAKLNVLGKKLEDFERVVVAYNSVAGGANDPNDTGSPGWRQLRVHEMEFLLLSISMLKAEIQQTEARARLRIANNSHQ